MFDRFVRSELETLVRFFQRSKVHGEFTKLHEDKTPGKSDSIEMNLRGS